MENFYACSNFPDCRNTKPIVKRNRSGMSSLSPRDKLLKENPKRTEFSLAAHAIQNVTLRHGINQ